MKKGCPNKNRTILKYYFWFGKPGSAKNVNFEISKVAASAVIYQRDTTGIFWKTILLHKWLNIDPL